jgi:hypothetical protein
LLMLHQSSFYRRGLLWWRTRFFFDNHRIIDRLFNYLRLR